MVDDGWVGCDCKKQIYKNYSAEHEKSTNGDERWRRYLVSESHQVLYQQDRPLAIYILPPIPPARSPFFSSPLPVRLEGKQSMSPLRLIYKVHTLPCPNSTRSTKQKGRSPSSLTSHLRRQARFQDASRKKMLRLSYVVPRTSTLWGWGERRAEIRFCLGGWVWWFGVDGETMGP